MTRNAGCENCDHYIDNDTVLCDAKNNSYNWKTGGGKILYRDMPSSNNRLTCPDFKKKCPEPKGCPMCSWRPVLIITKKFDNVVHYHYKCKNKDCGFRSFKTCYEHHALRIWNKCCKAIEEIR